MAFIKLEMEKNIEVSVICGVYHAQKYIGRLLDSILAQSFTDFEVILCMNACSDDSEQIAEKYRRADSRIKLIVTDKKLGAGGARANAFAFSSGTYIAVVDCDDYLAADYLKHMVDNAKERGYPDVVLTGFNRIDQNGKLKYKRMFCNAKDALYQSVAPWAKLYKRSFLLSNNILFRDFPFGEDILFTMDVIMHKPSISLAYHADYYWVDHPDSVSHRELLLFPEDTVKKADCFFAEFCNSKYIEEDSGMILYFMYKYMIWYLLQSGRGAGIRKMLDEYGRAMDCIEQKFQKWECRCIRIAGCCRYERMLVRHVLEMLLVLRILKLDKIAIGLYSVLPVERLWPSL